MALADHLTELLAFLKKQTKADHIESLQFQQLSGGAIQENYGLKVKIIGGKWAGQQAFVVRSDAPSTLSVSLTREQEFEVTKLASEAGVSAPKPYWLCTDLSIIGQAFYIMQWVEGSASPRDLVKKEALNDEQRQALSYRIGQEMAKLHQIQYDPKVLPFLKKPVGHAAQQRINEYQNALDQLAQPEVIIEYALALLKQYLPEENHRVLTHCDFRTGNYMVKDGQLSAVLDWEFTAWSDPYEDLGWMCCRCWRFGMPEREVGGVGDKKELIEGYQSIADMTINLKTVKYWELMAAVRWAVIALQQAQRYLSEGEESLELALTGRMSPEIQQDIMLHCYELIQLHDDQFIIPDVKKPKLQPVANHYQNNLHAVEPQGEKLLSLARSTLLNEVLSHVDKGKKYEVLMIASAMGMVNRELAIGPIVNTTQAELVKNFCQSLEINDEISNSYLSALVDMIRNQQIPRSRQTDLLILFEQLINLKLMLSNPKRLHSAFQEV